MTDVPHWQITGDWFDNCSCAVACPCTFARRTMGSASQFCSGTFDVVSTGISIWMVLASSEWADGKVISGRERPREQPAFSSMNAPTTSRPKCFGGQVGGFPALVAALFAEGRQVRGVERARIIFDIAPDRSHWGTEIAGKVKAWAKALTGPTSVPDKYPQLMNAPGSETGPGQIVTWGKSTSCSVDAFGYKFQWTTNSSKHIPFDWTGP